MRLIRPALIAALLSAATLLSPAAHAGTVNLTFLLTNDIYNVENDTGRGGFARLNAVVKAERAKGGVAAIVTEAMAVSDGARAHERSLWIYHDRFIPGLARLVEERDALLWAVLSPLASVALGLAASSITALEVVTAAGDIVRADAEHWVKAGVEYADGAAQLGAVVTSVVSDWSTGEVDWVGRTVTVRASRSGDALTVRARVDEEPWRLVRLAPIDPTLPWSAGPMTCGPSRAGLTVRFTSWTTGPADTTLH